MNDIMSLQKMFRVLIPLVAILGTGFKCELYAQDKIISNMRMIGVGSVGILDTYISPEKYSGTEIRYMSHTVREREGKLWSRLVVHQGFVSGSKNRADNGNEISGTYNFSYGFLHNWKFASNKLDIKAGGMLDATVGFLYNTRNGNNPVQAKLNFCISPVAIASYNFSVGSMPMMARYEVSMPLCGIIFSPNYGQSYYEIFSKGDYDHNVVPVTLCSMPSLRQMLSVDFNIGKTTLRFGYLGDWRQTKVNNLKYHSYSNMFVVGVTRRFKIVRL